MDKRKIATMVSRYESLKLELKNVNENVMESVSDNMSNADILIIPVTDDSVTPIIANGERGYIKGILSFGGVPYIATDNVFGEQIVYQNDINDDNANQFFKMLKDSVCLTKLSVTDNMDILEYVIKFLKNNC